MSTLLHLTDQTKEELSMIKTRLEQQTGEPQTLEDALRWLIARSKGKSFEDRKTIAKKLLGSLKDLNITAEGLQNLRGEKHSRYTDF